MLSKPAFELIDAIARTGSFSAAASELHKVPSSISHTVKQLETELDVILFERHHRSVSLTDAGKYFALEAKTMLQNMARMKKETQRVANGWQPSLSIAIDVIVCAERMNDLIADFYRNFNNVELIIRMEVFNGVWESLSTNRSDIAIGATSAVPVGGEFKSKDMGAIDWTFIVGKDHPLAKANHVLQEPELKEFPSICLDDTSRKLLQRNTWLLPNQRRLVVPDWQQVINCAKLGLGIGYIPKHLALPFLETGELIEKQVFNPLPPSLCCLAWNAQKASPALEWVLDYLGDSETLHKEWIA